MKIPDSFKASVIRTPFERPLNWVRRIRGRLEIRKHPEFRELFFESERIELALERLIGKTSNCIDVGCHLGSMLSTIMRLAPRGRHLAFEPVATKAALLRRKFPEVEIHEAALGETPGQ